MNTKQLETFITIVRLISIISICFVVVVVPAFHEIHTVKRVRLKIDSNTKRKLNELRATKSHYNIFLY